VSAVPGSYPADGAGAAPAHPVRVPLVAGNWKMHKTASEARTFLAELRGLLADARSRAPEASGALAAKPTAEAGATPSAEVAVCVPFTDLGVAAQELAGTGVGVYAQNMHHEPEGAFTGEISARMLRELGVGGVVLGHSERRAMFGETDRALALKLPAALSAGLAPMLCVGETEEQRAQGETERTLRHQVSEGLAGVDDERLADVAIAYEPVWAIGTGNVASTQQAQEACGFVRALVAARDTSAAERVRVLYGGSVKPENAGELLALPDVDGALVGGASLDAAAFSAIVRAAR
jgi:triosephosphate isomerase (TIM)